MMLQLGRFIERVSAEEDAVGDMTGLARASYLDPALVQSVRENLISYVRLIGYALTALGCLNIGDSAVGVEGGMLQMMT